MLIWIGFGILVAVMVVVSLYSALILASREDELIEEYFHKQHKEEK